MNDEVEQVGLPPVSVTPEIDAAFTYHAPKGNQTQRYVAIREAAKSLAATIIAYTPVCADQSAAIRKVREAVMTANAAIAINE